MTRRTARTSPLPFRGRLPAWALALAFATSAVGSGCDELAVGDPEPLHDEEDEPSIEIEAAPLFINGNMETGTNNSAPPNWTVTTYNNPSGTLANPTSFSMLRLSGTGTAATVLLKATSEGSQADSYLGTNASLRWPKYGLGVTQINGVVGGHVNSIKQSMTLSVDDIDPLDGKMHVRFAIAPVLYNPNHSPTEQPYFFVELRNTTKNTTLFQQYNYANQPGVPWLSNGANSNYQYTNWQLVDIAPTSAQAVIGDTVELLLLAACCSPTGHWARLYVDGIGATVPSLFVSATGPASANSGQNITYDMDYHNGGTGAAGSSVVKIVIPANTTYVSNTGGCTGVSVGGTGTLTCQLGTVNAGQSGTFQVTVQIGTGVSVGTVITLGNYTIESASIAPLIGPKVLTTITANAIYADLAITKDNGVGGVAWGQPTTYTMVVRNNGPSQATGAKVLDTMPSQLTGVSWSCSASSGGSCGTSSGSGSINNVLVNLPANGTATFTINASLIAGSGTSQVTNSASVTAPTGVTDSYPDNNSAGDTDFVGPLRTVTVLKAGLGTGTISSVPSAISCGTSCSTASASFVQGSQIVLSVNPTAGHTFEGWSGDACNGLTSNCTLTLNSNITVTATITKPTVPNGTPCSLGAECSSGLCIDGVCCNESCGYGASDCRACNVAGHVGTCSYLSTGAADNTCDNVDNDCDGSTDESFPATTTYCGTGYCARTGVATCSGGVVGSTCSPGSPAAGGEVCNNVDDDCDGQLDAADASLVLPNCEKQSGVCSGSKKTSSLCVSGAWQACSTTTYTNWSGYYNASSDLCDGRDNDCDGSLDESHVITTTNCGVGACARTGQSQCQSGSVVDTCAAGPTTGTDNDCDGIDDDCDGSKDESYVAPVTYCGVGACARTGLNTCVSGSFVNTCSAGTPAANDATCDNVDNDCSGQTDEDYVQLQTSCGVGYCARNGLTTCTAGSVGDTCVAGSPSAGGEVCDLVDNDCDGQTDAADGSLNLVLCEKQQGVCSGATKTASMCVAGSWQVCGNDRYSAHAGSNFSSTDACDGKDNDCDGTSDENFTSSATSCGTGACLRSGSLVCQSGSVLNTCTPGTAAATDTNCNGVDDNCNSATDEGWSPTVTHCGLGGCARNGWLTCVAGQTVNTCAPGTPLATDAVCDGVDDNCNGTADDGYVPTPTQCGVGACRKSGQVVCQSGSLVNTCAPGAPASSDADCDGVDDDCNGQADEDWVPVQTTCGAGACRATGFRYCVGGVTLDTCQAGAQAQSDVTCDAIDDDCNGQTDEDYAPSATTCGVGSCYSSGQLACQSGTIVNTCKAGTPAATDNDCDGQDDDCDGLADDNWVPVSTACGSGACHATGFRYCVQGQQVNSCAPGAPAAADATCDAIDDDCDGLTDENYATQTLTCGVGACRKSGQLTCQSGQQVNTCTPGTPAATDNDCDGVDDDCGGTADEDWVAAPTSCGVGACAATGFRYCVQGQQVDSCSAGAPAANDGDCDGVDDDCNGTPDDDFVTVASTCGAGACKSSGAIQCVQGALVNTCKTGPPAANDAACDAIDNDCDGGTDEDYPTAATACGVGACAATGQRLCLAGQVIDSCSAGDPASSDADCDGQDDDCDGLPDDDYVVTSTTCGVGAWATAKARANCATSSTQAARFARPAIVPRLGACAHAAPCKIARHGRFRTKAPCSK